MKKVFTKMYWALLLLTVCAAGTARAQDTKLVEANNEGATAMCRDASGNVFVLRDAGTFVESGALTANGAVDEYNSSGTKIGTVITNTGEYRDANEGDASISLGITVDASDNIYVTTYNDFQNSIPGNIVKYFAPSYSTSTTLLTGVNSTNYGYFGSLAMDSSGNLYAFAVKDPSNANANVLIKLPGASAVTQGNSISQSSVVLIDGTTFANNENVAFGDGTTTFDNDNGNYAPYTALAVDKNNNIFIASAWAYYEVSGSFVGYQGGNLYEYTPAGTSTGYSTANLLKSSVYCSSLGCDPNGDVFGTVVTNPGSDIHTFNIVNWGVGATGTAQSISSGTTIKSSDLYPSGLAAVSSTNVFMVNGNDGGTNDGDVYQLIGTPTTPASSVAVNTTTATTTNITWTSGGGAMRRVFMAATTGTGSPAPSNGTAYTANASFGGSGQVGSSIWYCVYNGAGTSVSVSNLSPSTTYRIMVVDYNGSDANSDQNYELTTSGTNPISFTTATPTISVPGGTVTLTSTISGTPGASTSFNLSASNLNPSSGSLTVTAPTNVQVSPDNSTWSSSYTQSYSGSTLGSTPVYVRLSGGGSVGTISGNVSVSGGAATTVTQAVSGSLNSPSTTISSLTAVSGTTTNASSVQWTATFAASVSGLSTVDFTLNTTGVSGAAISAVSGSGTSWTVTVNTGSGSGTIQLAMNSSSGVTPSVSNATSGSPFTGSTYTIDKTAPTVSSINAASPSNINPTNATSVTYTVTFSEAVTGVDASDFALTTSGTSGTVAAVSGSGTTYAVTVTSISGSGTLRLDLKSSGTGITDGAGNAISGGFTSGSVYTIDQTPPSVSSINAASPSNINPTNATSVTYTVTFSEAVTGVDASDFTVTTSGVSGSVSGVSGSGTTYAVTVSSISGSGTLRLDLNSSGTGITDLAGNAISGGFTSGSVYTIDQTPPTVSSITATTPSNTNPTNATSVTYTVTFSEAVTGVDASDFALTTSGTSGSVSGVSGSGTTYSVTVSSISGTGTLRLDLNSSGTGITDVAGNAISGGFTSGDVYNIDQTPPTVSSITATTPSNTNPTNATSVIYTVTFSKPVTGVDATDFTVTTSGTAGSVANVSGSGATYTVTVNAISGNGTLRLDLSNSGDPISDAAGNTLTSAFTSGDVYNIDNTAPTLTSLVYSSSNTTNSAFAKVGDVITLSFGTNEAIQTPSVSIAGHTIGAINTGGNNYSAGYTMTVGDTEGRIPFNLTVTDLAGNAFNETDVAAGDDITFDMTAPTAGIGAPSVAQVTSGGSGTVSYTVTYADANFNTSNLTSGGISLNTTGTATASIGVTGSGASYTVTLSSITGLGTIGINVAGGNASDQAGNTDNGAGPSATFNVVSGDATLSSLILSNGTLSPGFNSATTSYTAAVGYGLSNITITPTTNFSGATLKINGNIATSGQPTAVPLEVGINNVSIVVTAADGTTQQTYTITITEAQSYNNNLASVKTSAGFAQGSTVPSTMTENVINSITSLTVTPTVADPTATVTVNGVTVTSGQPSASIPLSVGKNGITLVVTAQDTRTQSYTLNVTRAPSANDKLSNLVVSSGTLSPAFGTATNYLDYVANGVPFSITPTLADPTATLTINGTAATSGAATTVPLTVGNNTVTIVVTAQNTTSTKTYTVVVNEARSPNSTLFSLTTSAGFSQGQTVPTTLTESVPNATSTITVTPTVADNTATVTVNGIAVTSGSASGTINLSVGANTITIVGTAQNGNTTTYTLTVTRAASSLLTNLTASAGSLNPAFAATTTSYAVYAPNGTTSTTITPTAASGATITVNGATVTSGTPSQAIATPVGNTTITVAVTAADNSTTTTYTVGVNVARAPNSTLYSLTTSAGFSQGQTVPTTLTESVPYATSSITVTPTMADNTATVTVNGATVASGSASSAINLSVGNNTITVVGTAQNGSTTTYTLTVTRAASANLSNLTLSAGSLSPAFASGTTAYSVAVGNGVTSIMVTPTATGAGAVIKVNGSTVTSGSASQAISLSVGNTNIAVTVTAADNSSTITYNVGVNRARSADDVLFSFKTSAGLAKGKTVPTTLTESVVNATSTITVTPTVDDATATVTVNGTTVASGTPSASIALAVGSNTITTIVTAQNGATLTYTLTVTRAMGSMNTVYQPIGVTKPNGDVQLSDDGINVHQGVSPNGDGINDFLQIDNISLYPDNNLKIMNRNGQLVYEAKGYDNATKTFDGHSNKNGQMQLPGTYFYSLDYTIDGVTKHKTGYLVLKY